MYASRKLGLKPHDPGRVAAVKAIIPDHVSDLLVDRVPKDWALGQPWDNDVLGNDILGDCFPAACVNWLKQMALACGRDRLVFTEQDAELFYKDLGWDGTDAGDNGVVMLDGMEYWTRNPVAGFQLDCFFRIGYADPTHLATALQFAPLLIGAEVTDACMQSNTWDSKAADSPAKGGHAFLLLSDSPGGGNVKTWGEAVFNTPDFRAARWRECYLPVCQDFQPPGGPDLLRLLTIAKGL
jgi:hypothetical protein